MTNPERPSPGDLPDAAAIALTEGERQLVNWLQDPDFDGNQLARQLLNDADHDQSD